MKKKKLTQDLRDTSNPSVVSTVGLSENETWRKSSGMPPPQKKYKTLNENQCQYVLWGSESRGHISGSNSHFMYLW